MDAVFLAGLGTLVIAAVVFRDVVEFSDAGSGGYDLLFRGGFFLVGVASLTVIAAAVHPTASMPRHLLGNRVMVYIGQRSYGLYLYHWPVFQMYRRFAGKGLTPYEFVLLALLSLALTELSYRYIEMPIRDGRFATPTRQCCRCWCSVANVRIRKHCDSRREAERHQPKPR
jgi:peptidoglycan/LPS O-acetylase OafA/YrhL